MKRIFIIISLLLLVLTSYSQDEDQTDYLDVSTEITLRDSTLLEIIDANAPSGTARNAGNALRLVGNDIDQGGDLDSSMVINGNGWNYELGTVSSNIANFKLYTSGQATISSGSSVVFGANGIPWAFNGTFWYSINGDTLTNFDDVRELIAASEPQLPFNWGYNFSSTITDSRPGVGLFRLNNATLANVTEIYIDYFDADGVAKNDFISMIDTGSSVSVITDENNYALYKATEGYIDNSNYFTYKVTYQSHSGVISGLSTIDLDISNSTGSGGGATAFYESINFDTGYAFNNTQILFSDPVKISDTLIIGANEYKIYEKNIPGPVTPLAIDDENGNSRLEIDDGATKIIGGVDSTFVHVEEEFIMLATSNQEENWNQITFVRDTLHLDGSGNSTANNIKVKNLYATDNIESDTVTLNGTTATDIIPSDSVMENTLVDKLQFNPTTQAYSDGTVFYDTNEKALTFYNNISDFKEELGRGVNVIFYNNTGSTIPNGTIVRSTGAKINGSINFYADLAGNSSLDSLQGVAMTTVETLDETFGIATLVGQVNGLNTSAYSDNDILYISHEGTYTNVNPEPPLWSVIIGRIQYADADSGSIYFFPAGDARYRPAPTFSASFSRESEGIANGGLDVFANITNATNDLFTETNNAGFLFQGDSVSALQDGIYTLSFSYSFQGDAAQNDDWRVGIFKNGVETYSTLRTSSLTNKGGVPFEATNSATSGDWFSFKIANTTSATRTSTFIDGVISITFND